MNDKAITKQLEEIAENICDHYCKYPEKYSIKEKGDDAYDALLNEVCVKCPLNKIM